MMALVFILLLLTVIVAWLKQQKTALGILLFTAVVASIIFAHHITDPLSIQL
jgi:hypothetical protein